MARMAKTTDAQALADASAVMQAAKAAARILGRTGGKSTTDKKRAASRRNGALGGRPRRKAA